MMIKRRIFFFCLFMFAASLACFGQASALRDYVGMISQSFHPDIVSIMEQFQSNLQRRGYANAARSIDHFLKGESGTGFLYVAPGGTNYIITNYHVISQAHTLSVTFEKVDGERTKFSDLTIIAADEELDIALLAFAGGQNPFRQGLAFLTRPVQEGDDVYSAGFPGLGTSMVWQLGRGMVSNASVRLPNEDEPGKFFGPFIQHTAQVDPGNSGGPLLVQTAGVPTGFAVAGINTLSARFRQAANFSIPTNRVQAFLTANIGTRPAADLAGLESRIDSFIEGLGVPRAVYSHIADYLSNTCTAENADFALSETFNKAPRTVQNDIAERFVNSPVDGMAYAVAWTIEDALRGRAGRISVYFLS
jgi:serine protease Do